MKNNAFQDFTKIYPLSKTLRFEAKPVGATLTNIIANGLLEQDEHRAESYVKVKQLIDEYHKSFMERVLRISDFLLTGKEPMIRCMSIIRRILPSPRVKSRKHSS